MANFTVFERLGNGALSFKVKDACRQENISINCNVTFDASQVQTYGGLSKGQIQPVPAIAGIGVCS